MEGRVFLLGNWKDYNELEENLSMPELLITLESYEKEKFKDRRFMAAMQGVELDDPFDESPTLEDIKARVLAKRTGHDPSDVVNIADEIGLGYEVI